MRPPHRFARSAPGSTDRERGPILAAVELGAERVRTVAGPPRTGRARVAALVLVLAALCGLYAAVLTGHVGAQPSADAQPSAIEGGARAVEHGASAASPHAGSALDRALSRDERALALGVAMVAVNEAGIAVVRPAEVALVYQVTEAQGETARERLGWLRSHSACVLGEHPPLSGIRPGNCDWSRNLDDSDAEPEGWSERYPQLRWSRYVERWQQVRELSRRLVAGELVMRPCPSTPVTWGGREIDMRQALARGLRPLGCRDPQTGEPTRNEGFARRLAPTPDAGPSARRDLRAPYGSTARPAPANRHVADRPAADAADSPARRP